MMSDEDEEANDESEDNKSPSSLLGDKVIKAVHESPNYTIKPTRLATLLGISVDDASAELCGLLSAVGGGQNGATFTFEELESKSHDGSVSSSKKPVTMVFQFPTNFEKKAKSYRRRQIFRDDVLAFLSVSYKYLKVVVAFGLVLSLFVLIVAALLVLLSITVAMLTQQRGNNRGHTAMMSHRIRSLLFTLREMMWFYAMFGGMFENEHSTTSPFLREIAGSVSTFISIFYGNPFHPSFWYRRSMMFSRRRGRMQRGWGLDQSRFRSSSSYISEGTWNNDIQEESAASATTAGDDESSFPGLVSIAAEFLFGSASFLLQEPSTQDKWRMRALIIASKPSGILSIREILPYVDSPPTLKAISNKASVIHYGLSIVSHFNGTPILDSDPSSDEAIFYFPEVIAEAECGGLPSPSKSIVMNEEDDISGLSILYKPITAHEYSPLRLSTDSMLIPKYLRERKYTLTLLQPKNFTLCIILGIVNYIGILWLKNAICEGGIFEVSSSIIGTILGYLLSFLYCYAKLFLLLPICRLVVILTLNTRIDARNYRRRLLAEDDAEKDDVST